MTAILKFNHEVYINKSRISDLDPVYFIADIAANHDGDIERAKDLIFLAKESGANAAKFQHFTAEKIVSDFGFKSLGLKQSHQTEWRKSVYDTYKHYEAKRDWTEELINTCKKVNIDFMTTPYDLEAIEYFAKKVPAFKIGSGDINWLELIEKMAKIQKPILLATGASSFEDVERAVNAILKFNSNLVIMQCNTNYTALLSNFKHINLNVLKTYASTWPHAILGLSDHTLGHTTVLGAVMLGARVIEKHFTDDNSREGPDHLFSMNPNAWRLMVESTKELELSLGDGIKKIEDNEKETAVLQRRCIRINSEMHLNQTVGYEHLDFLRPAPVGSISPCNLDQVIGKKLKRNLSKGEHITLEDLL